MPIISEATCSKAEPYCSKYFPTNTSLTENVMMQPETCLQTTESFPFVAGNGVANVGMYGVQANYDFPPTHSLCTSPFYSRQEMPAGSTDIRLAQAQAPAQARAIAASKNHKEAERRRRERINSHLNKLRSLLSCNSKTDKASLLAKAVQRLKELKQQSSELADLEAIPSETDEISVQSHGRRSNDGRSLMKVSLSCEDRSDLIPELIETLRSLRMNPLRAEIATLGGRTRSVLIVAGESDDDDELSEFLREGLKSLLHRSPSSDLRDRNKRRRAFDCS
ncbi:transcription factor bHLH106 [Diospyros lotus]|uniref:transcription factor bHLH106 n=1 Tax=Diospyros lotus TaxID=55363 RepID=UPI002250ECF0|nr:transcription factor bHLH106 [Diospyros lotus]